MELDELPKLTQLIDKVRRRLNPRLHISGILPCRVTMYGTHTSRVVSDVFDTLRLNFPRELLSTVVHESIRHGEAFSAQKPINEFDPGGTGGREYRAAVEELLAPDLAMSHG